jgi:hypothetical protein
MLAASAARDELSMTSNFSRLALVAVCGAAILSAASSEAGAQAGLRDRQSQIEQSIRRNYNARPHINSQQPAPYRFRERHLYRAPLAGDASPVVPSCAYQYRRWQRTGSKYWRNRYLDCIG